MAIPFSPRAALCTLVVVAGFGAVVANQLPGGLFGLIVWERDGLLPIDGGGTPREDDSREIVTAVLAHEARRGERGAVCVQLAEEGEALASERQEIARRQRAIATADAATRASLVAELDRRRNPARAWLLPASPGALPTTPAAQENARQLNAAETAVLGAPAAARIDLTLDMNAVPESLRSPARDCRVLGFTAPVAAGNVAFVETHFAPRAGEIESWLYAVTDTDGDWTVEAMARPWTD